MKHFALPVAIVVLALSILLVGLRPQLGAQAAGQLWEYKTIFVTGSMLEPYEREVRNEDFPGFRFFGSYSSSVEDGNTEFVSYLNELGAAGWGVVSTTEMNSGDDHPFVRQFLVLKRPL